ncbi:hypothetical protein BDR05DRAFT_728970 [Suillus weaverae]|nr:hypothetical protein BDR05DRAFT_728970 [Suillus weaverae]
MNDCYSCSITYKMQQWIEPCIIVILGVVMIARLHAMYQRSRKVLVYTCIIFLAASIASGVMTVIFVMHVSVEELVLSGAYVCAIHYEGNALLLGSSRWILIIGWEVFMLCLALWIVVKHFRELRRLSAGGVIEDCFTVLIKSHLGYFARCVHNVSVVLFCC